LVPVLCHLFFLMLPRLLMSTLFPYTTLFRSLLGPMLGTILLQLAGINGPELPNFLTNSAQLLIGIHVGLMLNIADVPNKLRTITLAFLSGILLVTGSIFLSFLLTYLQPL